MEASESKDIILPGQNQNYNFHDIDDEVVVEEIIPVKSLMERK